MSALKPCPFCGGEALYTPTCHIDVVQCRVCGAQGMAAMGQPEAAIAAWNRRAGADEVEKLRAEVERLRARLVDAAVGLDELAEMTWDKRQPDECRQACDAASEAAAMYRDAIRAALGDTP